MKKLLSLALVLALIFTFAACTPATTGSDSPSSEPTSSEAPFTPADIRVAGIKGPTGVGLASLMKANANGTAANNYTFTVHAEPANVGPLLIKGEVDIAAIPTNLASTLYKKTGGGIKILAVNTYGPLAIYENGNDVLSFADLTGKTIYSTGEGANPEYILRYILTENGINPDTDVSLQFTTSPEELVAKVAAEDKLGNKVVAMIPQPAATSASIKVPALRKVFDMTNEWENLALDSSLLMGCVVVRTKFLEENEAAVKKFLEEYEASIAAVSDVETVAALCEEFEIIPAAAVAKKAIPNCHIAYLAGENMKTRLGGYLEVMYNQNPASIGGALPDDNFYYIP